MPESELEETVICKVWFLSLDLSLQQLFGHMVKQPAMNFSATGEPYLLTSSRGSSPASSEESCPGPQAGQTYLLKHLPDYSHDSDKKCICWQTGVTHQ